MAPGEMVQVRAAERGKAALYRDPLYLFACHLEWRDRRDVKAYQELVAALDDCLREIRAVAEMLLHRSSPRPQPRIVEDTEQR